MTNKTNLDQAREWAEWIIQADSHVEVDPDLRGAANVIQSLPDEWIDADKLREFIQDWREGIAKHPGRGDGRAEEILTTLENDFLTPQPRTLADMTPEDQEACQWMQADFEDGIAERPIRVVITNIDPATVDIVLPGGAVYCVYPDHLTPLPDLPRMVWPDEHPEKDMAE